MKNIFFFFLLIFNLSFSQRSDIEKVGDFLQLGIPLAGLGLTYNLDDTIGRKQFWKSYISSISTTLLLKQSIEKTRPNGDCCESFPSGHTASAFAGAMFIQFRYGYKFGIPSLILASFVGYSRVEANKHFWEDVIAGATISTLANSIFTKRKINNNNISYLFGYKPYFNQILLQISF